MPGRNKLVYLTPAAEDMEEILRYHLEQVGPASARTVYARMRRAIARLAAYPLMFIAGYLLGPKRQSRLAAKERKAKKVAVRRAERRTLAEELTRGGGEVHYGQRNDAPGKGKKLI